MKKHLIAAAVATAIAAPAMAQNVTLSGRIDGGYSSTESTATTGVKTTDTGVVFNTFTTSRFALTGGEDLGGGLKAAFNIETGIKGTGTGSSTANDTTLGGDNTRIGDRQFNATLSGNFGSVLIGRTDSMVKTVYDVYDAGYTNNMVGSVDSLDQGATAQRDVTLRYTTPTVSGVSASVGVMKTTQEVSGAADTETNTGQEVGLRYSAGNLSASLAYRSVKNKTKTNAGDVANATSTEQDDLGLGASYNLGAVVLFGQYFDNEVKNKLNNTQVDEKFYAIGVRVPLGAATVYASYVDGEQKAATGTKFDREGFQLGVKYDMSKRTYAYVAYGDEESKAANNTKSSKDQIAVGIAHHF